MKIGLPLPLKTLFKGQNTTSNQSAVIDGDGNALNQSVQNILLARKVTVGNSNSK